MLVFAAERVVTSEQHIVKMMERATQSAPGAIHPQSVLAELEGWDSMGVVDFLGSLYDELGVLVTVDELQQCARVSDIVRRVVGAA